MCAAQFGSGVQCLRDSIVLAADSTRPPRLRNRWGSGQFGEIYSVVAVVALTPDGGMVITGLTWVQHNRKLHVRAGLRKTKEFLRSRGGFEWSPGLILTDDHKGGKRVC